MFPPFVPMQRNVFTIPIFPLDGLMYGDVLPIFDTLLHQGNELDVYELI
jgi:hypothetical protein